MKKKKNTEKNSYIPRNGILKPQASYISGGNLQSPKNKQTKNPL